MQVGQLDEEEAVAEVRQPERHGRRHERQPEAVHLPVERAVELETERVPAVDEQRGVDDERSREVADEHAQRPLLEHDDEQDGCRDRDRDVRERRRDVCARTLLDAKERRHLLVVHRRPEPDERGDHEPVVAGRPEQDPRDRLREHDAADEHRGRHCGDVPECRAHDEQAPLLVLRVEVEPEERALHRLRHERRQDGRQRHERLDQAEVARREIARVQRQQEHAEHARHDAAEAVHGRVAHQLLQPLEHHPSMVL